MFFNLNMSLLLTAPNKYGATAFVIWVYKLLPSCLNNGKIKNLYLMNILFLQPVGMESGVTKTQYAFADKIYLLSAKKRLLT